MNFKRFCGVALCLVVLCVASAAAFFRADRTDQMTSTIVIGNSRIDVVVEKGELKVSKEDLLKWVQWAAESVSTYYGRFPVHSPVAGRRDRRRPMLEPGGSACRRGGWTP